MRWWWFCCFLESHRCPYWSAFSTALAHSRAPHSPASADGGAHAKADQDHEDLSPSGEEPNLRGWQEAGAASWAPPCQWSVVGLLALAELGIKGRRADYYGSLGSPLGRSGPA